VIERRRTRVRSGQGVKGKRGDDAGPRGLRGLGVCGCARKKELWNYSLSNMFCILESGFISFLGARKGGFVVLMAKLPVFAAVSFCCC
jgi:hypothetical protein